MSETNELSKQHHHLAAVDWGTSNSRAYLIDEHGKCLDSLSNGDGVLNSKGKFESILMQHIGHWLNSSGSVTVILFGMIGSQVGWVETPYIECPVDIKNYAKHCIQLTAFNKGNCWIVPGVKWTSYDGVIDVMRGEELQVIGAYLLNNENENEKNKDEGLFCCPGTHNKWVSVKKGQIDHILTAMTGEVYSLLGKHSILSHSVNETTEWDEDAFISGLEYSQRTGGLLNHLFSVRTSYISGKHSQNEGSSYLSGLLIGHEIQSVMTSKSYINSHSNPHRTSELAITIIGSSGLCQVYSTALTYFNMPNKSVSAQSSVVTGSYSLFNL
ncbi:MAG: 2-dehydro-3-deoxygalactonokinase [Paraglaciecola sp.]|nr:2-dehydro-3-deoxygalactonokinase [Paraglaciecola sp.]